MKLFKQAKATHYSSSILKIKRYGQLVNIKACRLFKILKNQLLPNLAITSWKSMNLPPSAAALEIKRVRLPKIKSALNLKTWRS